MKKRDWRRSSNPDDFPTSTHLTNCCEKWAQLKMSTKVVGGSPPDTTVRKVFSDTVYGPACLCACRMFKQCMKHPSNISVSEFLFQNSQSNKLIHFTQQLARCAEPRMSAGFELLPTTISVIFCAGFRIFKWLSRLSPSLWQLFTPPSSVACWNSYERFSLLTWSDDTSYKLVLFKHTPTLDNPISTKISLNT